MGKGFSQDFCDSLKIAMEIAHKADEQERDADRKFWEKAEIEGLRTYRHIDQDYDTFLYEGIWRDDIFWSRKYGVTIFIPKWLMERELVEVLGESV